MNATSKPKSYQEWLQTAPMDELVQGLYERLTETHTEITALQKQVESLSAENNLLKMAITSHKHAGTTGEATIPAGVVLPIAG